jgi:iron complex outermembrane receptor protein
VQSSIANTITQDLYDIERIEVLKGPQGSIYGRNAIGGAINIVTRQPTNVFSGRVLGTWGNGDDRRFGAQLSGPIVDDLLRFRVAGKYREFGGLIYGETIEENVDFEEVRTLRASLMLTPTDSLSMTLTASLDDIEAGAAYYVPYSTLRALGRADRDEDEISKPRPVVLDHKGEATRRIKDVSLRIEWDTAIGTISSVSAFSTLDSYLDEDLDYTSLPLLTAIQDVDNEAISQELRLVSNAGGAFDWLAGSFLGIWQPLTLGCVLLGALLALAGFIALDLLWRASIAGYLERRRARRRRND